jgi:hypothetical protein
MWYLLRKGEKRRPFLILVERTSRCTILRRRCFHRLLRMMKMCWEGNASLALKKKRFKCELSQVFNSRLLVWILFLVLLIFRLRVYCVFGFLD